MPFDRQPVLDVPETSGAPPEPGRSSQKFVRSGQMVNCLRRGLLYTEKRAREFLFQAIEQLVNRSASGHRCAPLIVSRLGREAAGAARRAAEKAGYGFRKWDTASKAVINAMLNAGVLLTHGGAAIPPGITGQATEVVALQQGYRDLTEAYLLEFLIRELGDLTTRDHTALAHALFRQFDPSVPLDDLEDRVVVLLASLDGRVKLSEDGAYVCSVAGPRFESSSTNKP